MELAPAIPFETIKNNLHQSGTIGNSIVLRDISFSDFKYLQFLIDQINFLQKLIKRPGMSHIHEILGISSSHFYRVIKDPTYVLHQDNTFKLSPPRRNLLLDDEETFLLSSIKINQDNHRCMTSKSIRLLAEDIYLKRTGIFKSFDRFWWKRFMERNRALLKVQYITSLEESRASVKKSSLELYFDNLNRIKNLEIDPSLFLNMDETGCSGKPDKHIKGKCIVHSDSSVIPHMAEIDDYKQVSIAATITLQGTMLKPLLIIPRKRYHKELSSLDIYDDLEYIHSDSGYMNHEIMIHYITTILAPYIVNQRKRIGENSSPCVLIMDNLKSHYTQEVRNVFDNINDLHIIFLPPHTSHFLQPLDLSFFGIFKHYYSSCRAANPADTLKKKVMNIHKAIYHTSYFSNIKKSFSLASFESNSLGGGKFEIKIDSEKMKKWISEAKDE